MSNPTVTQIAPLPAAKATQIRELVRDRKRREGERAFVLEGEKPIRELHRTNASVLLTLVVTSEYLEQCEPDYRRAIERGPTRVYQARASQFDSFSDVRTSQGILAIVQQPTWKESAVLARPTVFGLYGEQLQDPANVGGLIRSALAFGVDALWLSPDSVDVWNPKVVRGTAGAVLSLPIFSGAAAEALLKADCVLMAACPQERRSQDIRQITSRPPKMVIALGNESRGLSDRLLNLASLRFHIPIGPAVDSLNVATAAAIAIYHFAGLKRQEG
jgi:TrmH family RNA methyltransferase